MAKSCQNITCHCTDFNQRFCKWFRAGKPSKSLKRAPKNKKKLTGEMGFFRSEWVKRGGYCAITGERIDFSALVCFHVLGKGAFPRYRKNPDNLIFVKAQKHLDWHTKGMQRCLEEDPRWQTIIDKYNNLKDNYQHDTRIYE